MRNDTGGGRARTLSGQVLSGRDSVHPVRSGSSIPLSLGDYFEATEDVRVLGDAGVYRDRAGRIFLYLEKRRAGLGNWGSGKRKGASLMELAPAVTDLDQLKGHPAIARLLAWNPKAVEGVKFDRDEMTIIVERSATREACALLPDHTTGPF